MEQKNGTRLRPEHERMLLEGSGITLQEIEARGYRSVEKKAELEGLGFGRSQRNIPGLLIPVFDPSGELRLYQYRPDEPRIKDGRPVKYETPGGSRMALDVHPFCRDNLGNPGVPLFVTEGIKKGDSLSSRGLCAVALIGVWNWRGTNGAGGKTALAQWEYVALNGRRVYIVFDSDVMQNQKVFDALRRLSSLLELRGADVKFIYLPSGEAGAKQGVDDFLAAGGTVDDLLEYATDQLKKPPWDDEPSVPYRTTEGGLVWDKPTQNGTVTTPLTNFNARIVADVAEDDGAEVRRWFGIEARLKGRPYSFSVPSAQFVGMGWVMEHMGAGAIVYPGFVIKDHVRTAIQSLSGDVPTEHVYAHSGWREIDGEGVYLHAGGAIGRVGRVDGVWTKFAGSLGGRTLPAPPEGEELKEAIEASLRLLLLAPPEISFSLLAAPYRAALGNTDFSLHISGPTGEGKSELAALCQQHFGAGLDARTLTSWESTENAIEGLAFQLKDQVMVIDDFAPTGTTHDVQHWHKKADRVLRAKGNASGRQRMRADTTLRSDRPPRSLIVSTGEDVPRGQSLRARLHVLELGPGQLDFSRLSDSQRDAASGLYAAAMSGFVRWLAPRYGEIRSGINRERAALRESAVSGQQHRRTPNIVADLALGLRYMLRFAVDVGAIDNAQAETLWAEGWRVLGVAAAAQQGHQAAGDPARRFAELLSAAVSSGRAHVAGPDGSAPETPEAWGWRRVAGRWCSIGDRVGWVDGVDLYLEPESAYAAAQNRGQGSGDAFTLTSQTLKKRLHERGALASTDESRQVLTIRRTLEGSRRNVLHVPADFLSNIRGHPDQPDQNGREHQGSVPPL